MGHLFTWYTATFITERLCWALPCLSSNTSSAQDLVLLFAMHPSGLLCKFSCGSLGGDWGTAVTEGALVDVTLPAATVSDVVDASATFCVFSLLRLEVFVAMIGG